MVIRDGKVIYKRAFGYADVEKRVRAKPNTNYRLASVTKQFTAMAILVLAERKKVSLDATLTEIFPDFPAYGAQIRVRHLLNHTSGLLAYEDLIPKGTTVPVLDRDVLAMMKQQSKTYFPPGERYRYSNSGYAVLAQIVERVSGQGFAEFLRANIFQPLKMNGTIVIERDNPRVVRRAYGYSKRANGMERTDQSLTSSVQGDGGVYSSVEDLRRWDAALYTEKLVSGKILERAFTVGIEAEPGVGYGFGWFIGKRGGDRALWHSGTTVGFRTFILWLPERRFTVIVLANRADADAVGLGHKFADIFLGGTAKISGSGADLTM
jgi:CubicO group peptidase (beta-lactamase class C family)